MKSHEYNEGPEASERFVGAMRGILSVSREELQRRENTYKEQAALQPKRGPKPKRSSISSRRVPVVVPQA